MAVRKINQVKISEEFEENLEDETIQEAVIISETKTNFAQKEEVEPDEFSQFLSQLPTDSEIKFIVTRLADRNLSGQFRLPCLSDQHTDNLYWTGETDPSDIYSQITKKHGGGRYRIQIRGREGFAKNATWTITLSDPVELSDRENLIKNEKAKADEQERKNDTSQMFANPIPQTSPKSALKEFLEQAQEFKQLQELLAPQPAPQPQIIQQPAAPVTAAPVTKESIKLTLIQEAVKEPELLKMALRSVFEIQEPITPEDKPSWFENLALSFASNPEIQEKALVIIGQVAAPLIGLLTPKVPPVIAEASPQPPMPQFDLSQFKQPRNEEPAAPIQETQSDATEQAKADDLPFIELEEK